MLFNRDLNPKIKLFTLIRIAGGVYDSWNFEQV